jgi:hypothetical protein
VFHHASGLPWNTSGTATAGCVFLVYSRMMLPPKRAESKPACGDMDSNGLCMGGAALDRGVMVGPGFFQTVREFLNRLHTLRSPDQKSCHRCTSPADYPDEIFHVSDAPLLYALYAFHWSLDANGTKNVPLTCN